MKKPLRSFILNFAAFFIVAQFLPGIDYAARVENLLLLSFVFAVLSVFVRPILKLLLLPLNLLTLGLIGSLINIGLVYGMQFFLPFFKISSFTFPGVTWENIAIPAFYSTPVTTIVILSLAVSLLVSILYYLLD
jgi:putative membrane protein